MLCISDWAFSNAASVKLMYQPQPTPAAIPTFKDLTIRAIACGHNHSLALDDKQAAYTWGATSCLTCILIPTCSWVSYNLKSTPDFHDLCSQTAVSDEQVMVAMGG